MLDVYGAAGFSRVEAISAYVAHILSYSVVTA